MLSVLDLREQGIERKKYELYIVFISVCHLRKKSILHHYDATSHDRCRDQNRPTNPEPKRARSLVPGLWGTRWGRGVGFAAVPDVC